MKKVLATIVLIILFLSGCLAETTMTTTDLIAAEAIEQDQDVIRLNDRVYRLDQVVTVSDLSLTPGPRVQKIASEKTLEDGMATHLKSGTVIYQEKDDTMFIYVQRNKKWYRYQSIPEG
ncbi:hypothetical protein AS033_05785 [Exiguobacterium indicum]|uniref:Uncharacterized protein n=2 Tax=Exiguobacterium indicum TaxID=296995 RepID=A0A0V8GKW0_9BACL|nr:hypothetical protein [Exiguobacterium enclense]KSU50891.1 hypothetical protein AS033_05785 [Exiguobacterium enclense]SDC14041.1 hypothetical protein SAMN05216342_1179 [Exiguobacterium enclense]